MGGSLVGGARIARRLASMLTTLALVATGLAALSVALAPPASADASPAPANSRQLITVNAPTAGSTTASLFAYEHGADGFWHLAFGPIAARVGDDGIGAASEGSGRTPAGTFALTQAFGRLANPGTKLKYFQTDSFDWWDENPSSPTYNLHVRQAGSPGGASENLYYSGRVYDYAVNMNYNLGRVPGAGSAFFLHVTNGQPTAGCVAVSQADMARILKWLDPAKNPYISNKVGAAWKPTAPVEPVGTAGVVRALGSGKVNVTGWAVNPATPNLWVRIRIAVSGPTGSGYSYTSTGDPRSDVDHAFYWAGPRTGYHLVINGRGQGWNKVCVQVYDVKTKAATTVACQHLLVT